MGIKEELQKIVEAERQKLGDLEGVHEIGRAEELARLARAKEQFAILANQLRTSVPAEPVAATKAASSRSGWSACSASKTRSMARPVTNQCARWLANSQN